MMEQQNEYMIRIRIEFQMYEVCSSCEFQFDSRFEYRVSRQ